MNLLMRSFILILFFSPNFPHLHTQMYARYRHCRKCCRYNNQLSVLRSELRTCKRKATEQAKQIAEQQKLLAEQQKQTLDYANRLDENDKKNEEISRKFSTLLQVGVVLHFCIIRGVYSHMICNIESISMYINGVEKTCG